MILNKINDFIKSFFSDSLVLQLLELIVFNLVSNTFVDSMMQPGDIQENGVTEKTA